MNLLPAITHRWFSLCVRCENKIHICFGKHKHNHQANTFATVNIVVVSFFVQLVYVYEVLHKHRAIIYSTTSSFWAFGCFESYILVFWRITFFIFFFFLHYTTGIVQKHSKLLSQILLHVKCLFHISIPFSLSFIFTSPVSLSLTFCFCFISRKGEKNACK